MTCEEMEAKREARRAEKSAESLYLIVKCHFLAFNASTTPQEYEFRQERLLKLLRDTPGAQAAFDRMAQAFLDDAKALKKRD